VAVRPRGWFRLLVGVCVALGVPFIAQLRLIVPIEQTMLFIGPTMASAALVSWWLGGRAFLFAAWATLSVWMLLAPRDTGAVFHTLSVGWVVMLAAAFGLVSLRGNQRPFFPRALAATAITFGCALLVLLVGNAEGGDVGRTVADEFARRLQAVTSAYEARAGTPEWQDMVQRYPALAALVTQGEQQLPALTRWGITLFPALLGLQSMALLALGWALFHRASRTRVGPPLSHLSQFKFSDQLIWGIVLGTTILVVPSMSELRPIGLNVLVFFGALFALRGLGVLSWFLAPGRPAPVLLVLAAALAGPVVGVFALGLGLADTWIDWRGRLKPAA
jgi:hypothetical protein